MPFNTLGLSVATVGIATLAFATAAPASAQEDPPKNTMRTRIMGAMPIMARFVRLSFTRSRCRPEARSTFGGRWGR